jgi:peptidoglycan hydrolase CwlO-like protein
MNETERALIRSLEASLRSMISLQMETNRLLGDVRDESVMVRAEVGELRRELSEQRKRTDTLQRMTRERVTADVRNTDAPQETNDSDEQTDVDASAPHSTAVPLKSTG